MKKSILTLTICFLAFFSFGQNQSKPDSLKWSVNFDNTAIRNRVLSMLDTIALTINNSDIPSKDRVKVTGYMQAIIQYMAEQFKKENLPVEPAKEKIQAKEVPKVADKKK